MTIWRSEMNEPLSGFMCQVEGYYPLALADLLQTYRRAMYRAKRRVDNRRNPDANGAPPPSREAAAVPNPAPRASPPAMGPAPVASVLATGTGPSSRPTPNNGQQEAAGRRLRLAARIRDHPRCWNCGQEGHERSFCRQPRSIERYCYQCGQRGVTRRTCGPCNAA